MKRALVTGGSGDIGSAICRRLAADGYHVIVHANRNRERADQLVQEIKQNDGSAESCCFDLSDTETCAASIEKLLADDPIKFWCTTPASTVMPPWRACSQSNGSQ
jgi:3-oxoacyl-[acyl-carrier protein] reductase